MNDAPLAALVGADTTVPVVDGRRVRYVNLDYAASAPALMEVAEAVGELLPWYASVHRGAGYKSLVSTAVYEEARSAVAAFVGARPDDAVVFTRSTTDALNILAGAVPEGGRVVTFDAEHHANLLPWRRRSFVHLPTPATPDAAVDAIDDFLANAPNPTETLVSVAGASNVTGELWPIARLAETVHRHGARLCVDAAQWAPHAPIDMVAEGIDYLALSGHKLYAPYGSGALVGRTDWLATAEPLVAGGGAVQFVSVDDVQWADVPGRFEAGSPNVVGAAALGTACRALARIGMDKVAAHEHEALSYLRQQLAGVAAFEQYALWPDSPRIAVVTGNLAGRPHGLVATALSAEYGIGVRDGCFCAHPLMMQLLGVDPTCAAETRAAMAEGRLREVPGAVRISTGLGTTSHDIDAVAAALAQVADGGPRWQYRWSEQAGGWRPDPETRPLLPFSPAPKEDLCRP
ncbi:MAG TPA: aminotransferase class V-fold PLP-dependent enzyme [Acidimicrobiales bacterium]|nr:aminotransferase class V-fold PLP-dependent enzyme [Acidimicrobiales bacterium]